MNRVGMKTQIMILTGATLLLGASIVSAKEHVPSTIACAQERGAALGHCSYRVKKGDKAKTTVTVIFNNGFERRLFFRDGMFLKASVTMSGVGINTEWHLESGMYMIEVDGQRYEVPESLISAQ